MISYFDVAYLQYDHDNGLYLIWILTTYIVLRENSIYSKEHGDREFVNNCSSLYVDLPSCNILNHSYMAWQT